MTTIAAIQGDGFAVIAADRRASDDDGFTVDMVSPKIFKNGIALIGGAGSVRGLNILEFGWTAPAFAQSKTVEHYLTQKFIPSLRSAFIEAGYDMKSDKEAAEQDNDLVICIKGQVFIIAGDYSWDRCSRGIHIAGSGGKYALGALAALGATDKKITTEKAEALLRKSIAIAMRWDAYSGGEVDVFTQEA